MLEKIKNHKTLVSIVLALVFVVPIALLVFRFLQTRDGKPDTAPTPTPLVRRTEDLPLVNKQELPELRIQPAAGAEANELGVITYSLQEPNLQTTLPIYTIIRAPFTEAFIESLARAITPNGIQSTEGTSQYPARVWVDGKKRLTFRTASGIIEYSNNTITPTGSLSQKELITLANNFLRDIGLTTSQQNNEPRFNYYSSQTGDLVEVDTLDAADIIDLTYSEMVDGRKVYRQYGSDAQIHVWVSKSGTVVKLSYKKPLIYQATGRVAALTFPEAKGTMNFAVTVALLDKSYHADNTSTPTATELTSIETGYIEDSTGKLLLPIYVFGGISKVQNDSKPVIVYLPAFK